MTRPVLFFAKTEPTPAQARAGRYPKRKLTWRGLPIAIETEKGEVRRGRSRAGVSWEITMSCPYGEIEGTEGVDGDPVDVFLGPDQAAPDVYVITTNKVPDFKEIDEQKCMLGFRSAAAAKAAFLANYTDKRFFRSMTSMPFTAFKAKVLATAGKPTLIKALPILFLKAHISGYTKQDGTVVAAHEDIRKPAQMDARSGGWTLPSGAKLRPLTGKGVTINSVGELLSQPWLPRDMRKPEKIDALVRRFAFAVGGNPGKLSDEDVKFVVDAVVARNKIIDAEIAEKNARKEAEKRALEEAYAKTPAGIAAAEFARKPLAEQLAIKDAKMQAEREAEFAQCRRIANLPIAKIWNKGRREQIEQSAQKGYVENTKEMAKSATLEALVRIGKKDGFTLRHTSNSSGKADSRYLCKEINGRRYEVRLSDHEIPVYGERADRYASGGGPRWGEIVIDLDNMAWTPERWVKELRIAAGLDKRPDEEDD